MNHPFSPSALEPKLCATCKREVIDHTDRATCEVCGSSGEMNLTSNNILMCLDCDFKDTRPRTEDELNDRAVEVKRRFQEIDSHIRISTDIFNAKTIAIHHLKKAIDENPQIPADKKHYELAQLLAQRFDKLNDVIFGAKDTVLHAETEQRAIQTYYNELGKKLRTEEREKIRLKDATYQPIVKPDVKKTPKAPSVKKVDGNAIRAACVQAGIPEAVVVVTTVMVARKCTIDTAINVYKASKAALGK